MTNATDSASARNDNARGRRTDAFRVLCEQMEFVIFKLSVKKKKMAGGRHKLLKRLDSDKKIQAFFL